MDNHNPEKSLLFVEENNLLEQDLYKCVHCGFCLQACPTYVETGLETESPRGRIALMKAVNEGRLKITPTTYQHWDLCIKCRACEPACPSGVPYGKLIEATMEQVERYRKPSIVRKLAISIILRRILPNPKLLGILLTLIRLSRLLGIETVASKTGLLNLISPKLSDLQKSAPAISGTPFKTRGQIMAQRGRRRATVALLSGCVMPLIHGPQMDKMSSVLTRNGCQVLVPKGQVCCGAINSHLGDLNTARQLAKSNIDVFLQNNVDAIISASAGCSARMKEYGELLKDDQQYAGKANQIAGLVKDVHEFLVDLPIFPPLGRINKKVTYQDPCHLSHAQLITEAPRKLLRLIPGIELVEMVDSNRCCGAGGAYSITQREFSIKLLNSKMGTVLATHADILAVANPGCYIQLETGVASSSKNMDVCYITDLLYDAYNVTQ